MVADMIFLRRVALRVASVDHTCPDGDSIVMVTVKNTWYRYVQISMVIQL